LRDDGRDAGGQLVGVEHVSGDESDAHLPQARQAVRVAAQAVELRDQQDQQRRAVRPIRRLRQRGRLPVSQRSAAGAPAEPCTWRTV